MAEESHIEEMKTLRRRERMLRATFDHAAVGMAHVGLDGAWLDANERLCKMLGYERDELIGGMSFQDVTYPDDLPPDVAQYERLLKGEIDRYTLDKRYFRKDGSVVWVNVTPALVRDEDGEPDFFVAVVQDITRRKRIEEALRQSEQHYRIMGEALPYGVWMCDTQGRAEYMSPSFLDLLEMTLEEAREFGWSNRLPPDERESTLEKWMHCVETGEHWNDEHHILGPDDRYHAVLTRGRPVRDAKGEIVKWVGINLDIDDRKQMEHQLMSSKERLRLALEAAELGTWDWDVETGDVTWDGYAVDLFGASPDGFDEAYRLIAERVHPADREALERVVVELGDEDEDDFSMELRLLGPADAMQWVEVRGRAFRGSDGETVRISGVVQDVTERQRLRERRAELLRREQEARREAEEASAIKSRFLAMVSHELRTPLTSIMGFSSTLLAPDVTWDAESQQDFISTIHEEAEKLKDLVEQLLEVSRLQSGTLRMERSRIRFGEALEIAEAQLQTLVDEHALEVNVADDLPDLDADAQRIAQVIVNLVSNAVKYSPPGSRIRLIARRVDGVVRVDVSDEGPGIPPEAREFVFEAFRQIDRSGGEGAGLGLAICKGLVEAHGGRIWVVDGPPPGATLAFTLPPADEH